MILIFKIVFGQKEVRGVLFSDRKFGFLEGGLWKSWRFIVFDIIIGYCLYCFWLTGLISIDLEVVLFQSYVVLFRIVVIGCRQLVRFCNGVGEIERFNLKKFKYKFKN